MSNAAQTYICCIMYGTPMPRSALKIKPTHKHGRNLYRCKILRERSIWDFHIANCCNVVSLFLQRSACNEQHRCWHGSCHIQPEPLGGDFYTTDSSEFPPRWAEPVVRPEHVNNMPAPSSRQTETDAGTTDRRRPSEPRSSAASHDVVSLVSRLVDEHLALVRVGV